MLILADDGTLKLSGIPENVVRASGSDMDVEAQGTWTLDGIYDSRSPRGDAIVP